MVDNSVRAMFFQGGTEMGGAFWFLEILFKISICYCVVDFALKMLFKQNVRKTFIAQWLISVVFLLIGFCGYVTGQGFAGFGRVFSYYVLFHGGYTVKKYGWSNKNRSQKVHFVIFTLTFFVLSVCNRIGSINLDVNSYTNPLFFLIVSFSGWQFMYELSYFVCKFSHFKAVCVGIGKSTLAIVILHFLCFKIVSFIGVLFSHQPLFLVAAFPFLFHGGVWWVAYCFVGMSVPVVLNLLWTKIREKLSMSKRKQLA